MWFNVWLRGGVEFLYFVEMIVTAAHTPTLQKKERKEERLQLYIKSKHHHLASVTKHLSDYYHLN